MFEYDEVFNSDLGTLKDVEADLTVNQDCETKFCKARLVPYALKKIEKDLERLIANDIYESI